MAATETRPNTVDDVPLLGTQGYEEKPAGDPMHMPSAVAYPAQPQSRPPIQGGGATFAPAPAPQQYHPLGPGQQSQSNTNVNVVTAQPPPSSMPQAPNPQPVPPANPTLMVITIVGALMLFFFGLLPAWFCIFPAVIFAIIGFTLGDSPKEDQRQMAKLMNGFALGCSIAALITFIMMLVIMIICIIVFAVA